MRWSVPRALVNVSIDTSAWFLEILNFNPKDFGSEM